MPPMIAYDFLFGGMRNRTRPTASAVGARSGGSVAFPPAVTPTAGLGLWAWVKRLLRRPAR